MPSLPITIGELTDVPTFDSPIASPWAQEVSRRVTHRFATTGERDTKYPPATAGTGAVCAVGAVMYISDGTRWIGGHYGFTAGWTNNAALNAGAWSNMVGWVTTQSDGFQIDGSGNVIQLVPIAGTFSWSWWVILNSPLTKPATVRMLYGPTYDMRAMVVAASTLHHSGLIRITPGSNFNPQVYLDEPGARTGTGGFFEMHRTGP